jgi:cytochrome c peroxidase
MSDSALRGASLFVGKARCASCHNGPHFSDGLFHNLGVPQTGDKVPASDDGRYKDVPPLLTSPFSSATAPWSDDTNTGRLAGLTNPMPESTRGAFRTASLRNVALTPPYMHSGQINTLSAVIDFYNGGGLTPVSGTKDPLLVPLFLTTAERTDLVAFLESLSGEPVAASLLVDTSTP